MSRKYTRWTKEKLESIVLSSTSYAECLRKMNLIEAGGNYKNLQKNIEKYNINTSHMKGQAHNAGKELKLFENLQNPQFIKKRLINELGHICQKCLLSIWNSIPITLELEHIDGNNKNNERHNLTLLCPNCHSQTKTWRNRKR